MGISKADGRFPQPEKLNMRPLYESLAKEKSAKISLIEAENEDNNELLASFSTKSSGSLVIFTRHLTRAKVSTYKDSLAVFD